jgi:hypothetical protein
MKRATCTGLALGAALICSSLAAQPVVPPAPQPIQQPVAQPVGAAAAPVATAPTAPAASAPRARVTFQLDHTGAMVPRFTLAIEEDGRVSYVAEQAVPEGAQEGGNATSATQHVEQRGELTPATTARIFELARASDRFNVACEALAKNVADMGRKTLRYSGPEGDGSCVYNFSEIKSIATLTQLLQGITMTLDMGRKLDFDHRFDRLGLDEDTSALVETIAQGRAVEVNLIARTLRSIAEDSEVMERVRSRASSLLQRFPPVQ